VVSYSIDIHLSLVFRSRPHSMYIVMVFVYAAFANHVLDYWLVSRSHAFNYEVVYASTRSIRYALTERPGAEI